MDLEKFFDTMNHDRIMTCLAKRIKDKALLRLIGRYLRRTILSRSERKVRRKARTLADSVADRPRRARQTLGGPRVEFLQIC